LVFIEAVFFTLRADSGLFHDKAMKIKEIAFCALGVVWYVLKYILSFHLRLLFGNVDSHQVQST